MEVAFVVVGGDRRSQWTPDATRGVAASRKKVAMLRFGGGQFESLIHLARLDTVSPSRNPQPSAPLPQAWGHCFATWGAFPQAWRPFPLSSTCHPLVWGRRPQGWGFDGGGWGGGPWLAEHVRQADLYGFETASEGVRTGELFLQTAGLFPQIPGSNPDTWGMNPDTSPPNPARGITALSDLRIECGGLGKESRRGAIESRRLKIPFRPVAMNSPGPAIESRNVATLSRSRGICARHRSRCSRHRGISWSDGATRSRRRKMVWPEVANVSQSVAAVRESVAIWRNRGGKNAVLGRDAATTRGAWFRHRPTLPGRWFYRPPR